MNFATLRSLHVCVSFISDHADGVQEASPRLCTSLVTFVYGLYGSSRVHIRYAMMIIIKVHLVNMYVTDLLCDTIVSMISFT